MFCKRFTLGFNIVEYVGKSVRGGKMCEQDKKFEGSSKEFEELRERLREEKACIRALETNTPEKDISEDWYGQLQSKSFEYKSQLNTEYSSKVYAYNPSQRQVSWLEGVYTPPTKSLVSEVQDAQKQIYYTRMLDRMGLDEITPISYEVTYKPTCKPNPDEDVFTVDFEE